MMDTINTYCISCRTTTPHIITGTTLSITKRWLTRMTCWKCQTQKQEMGRPERIVARSKAKDNLKHGPIPHHRPDLLRSTNRIRFIQGGCAHCGGDLRTDFYEPTAMTCFQCGRAAGQEVA